MGQNVTVSVGNGLDQYELFRKMSQAVLYYYNCRTGAPACTIREFIYVLKYIYVCNLRQEIKTLYDVLIRRRSMWDFLGHCSPCYPSYKF